MRLLLAALFALSALPAAAQVHEGDESGVLVLGRVSDDPKAHYDQLKPLLDYVVPRLRDVGIREGRILMARNLQQMSSYLRRGRVDWVTETSGNGMLLAQRANAQPILLTERNGVSSYRTLFFARRDSRIAGLADLKGRKVAFQNPYSTSSYYVPAAELLRTGKQLELLLSPMDRAAGDSVGYVFARTELNITTWVHKRLVDVGVLNNLDWEDPHRMPPAFRQDFVVIAECPPVPRALELVSPGMEPRLRERLREVLLEAAADPEAGEALRRFFGTTRFLPLDAGTQASLQRLAAGVRKVREEVE